MLNLGALFDFSPSRTDVLEGEVQRIQGSRYQEASNWKWLIERIEALEKRVAELEAAESKLEPK